MTDFQVAAICMTVLLGAACIATHSAEPLWFLVLLFFFV
jgi:hypothetical protein